MSTVTRTSTAHFPLPERKFWLWQRVWHLMTLLTLLFFVGSALWFGRDQLGGSGLLLVLIALAQYALYLFTFHYLPNRRGWPLALSWQLLYFGGGVALTLAAAQLAPFFIYLIWMYTGHMVGTLPVRRAIVGATLAMLLIRLGERGWQVEALLAPNPIAASLNWLILIGIVLYIKQLTSTSEQRSQLIQQLQSAQAELEQARARDAELATLRERERLARDMHDGLGHALVALSVQLEAAQRLYQIDPAQGSQRIDDMKRLTRQSMEMLRRTLAGLRAEALDDLSLIEALRSLCHHFSQRSAIHVDCQLAAGDFAAGEALPDAVAEVLWRVAQEALTNVEKHSAATRVTLSLSTEANGVRLCVVDNGVGLLVDVEAQASGFGLRGMRERVEGLGGELIARTDKPGGTRVEAFAPLPSQST